MSKEMKLPELGENIEGAQVLTVLVSPGDTIRKDQPVIELETDKATAEVPSDVSGKVTEVKVKEGDSIKVGQVILTVEDSGNGSGAAASTAPPSSEAPKPARQDSEPEAKESGTRRPEAPEPEAGEREREPEPAPRPRPELREVRQAPAGEAPDEGEGRTGVRGSSDVSEIGPVVPAAPSVRRLARELGIDIGQVPGSGAGGRISQNDVMSYTRRLVGGIRRGEAQPGAAVPGAGGPATPELPDFSPWGEVEREPASKIRRLTGEAMALSWRTIPHVTQFDRADVTDLEAWRKRYNEKHPDAKVTVTAVAVKVAAAALVRFPHFNASFDDRRQEIVLKKYVNVGVAVDTDRGLLVPTIKDADRKGVLAIASELNDLAERARTRKIAAEELQGANFNISNLGGLGTTYFSPIVNWPQVAVVGIGRAATEPVWREGAFAPRFVLPLAVSYDHRAVDGADAARFLRWFAEALEQPLVLALES